MGKSMNAHLAYGVNLGTTEDPQVGPKDPEYGGLADEWYEAHGLGQGDEEDASDWDWGTVLQAAVDKLTGFTEEAPEPVRVDADNARGWDLHPDYEAWMGRKHAAMEKYGLSLDFSGSLAGEDESGLLIVVTSTHHSVSWTEVLRLDLGDFHTMTRMQAGMHPAYLWDTRIRELLAEVGLTLPDDNEPGWIVYPSYG